MPDNENDISGKVSLDLTNFKANISSLNQQIKVIDSGFRAAAAGMTDWGSNADGLHARIKSLSEIIELQKQKVDNLKEVYTKVAAEKGENSKAAQDLQVRINNETAALNKNLTALGEAKDRLSKLAAEETEAERAAKAYAEAQASLAGEVDSLKSKLALQRSEFRLLDDTYNDNKDSVEAFTNAHDNLSGQLDTQKAIIDKLNRAVEESTRYTGEESEETKKLKTALNEAKSQFNQTEDAVDRYGREVSNAGDKTLKFGDILKANIIGDAIIDGVKALGNKIKDVAADAFDCADRVQQLADQTGLTAEKIQELTYIGDTLGVSTDTITGSFSKLINNMSSAATGSGIAYNAFQKLGIKVTDNNDLLRSSQEVWQEATTALGKITNETERTAIAQDIFGRSASDLNPLIKASADELAKLSQQAYDTGAVMSNSTVSALDDFGDTLGQLKQSVTATAGTLLEKLLPSLQPLIDKVKEIDITPVANFLSFIIDNAGTIAAGLAGIGAGFAVFKVASLIQSAVTAFQAFKLAQEGATIAQWALNVAMDANPIGIIVLAVAALVAGIVLLVQNWDTVTAAVSKFANTIGNALKPAIDAIVRFITNTIPNVFDTVVTFFSKLPERIAAHFKGIMTKLGEWADSIGEWLDGILTFFKELPVKIVEQFTNILTGLSQWATNAAAWAAQAIPNIINAIFNFFNELPGKIGYALGYTIGTIIQWGKDAVAWVTTNIPIIIDSIVTFFKELPGKLLTILTGALETVKQWGSDIISWITTNVPLFVESITTFFSELPGKLLKALTDAINTVRQWGSDILAWIGKTVPDIIENIVSFFSGLPEKITTAISGVVTTIGSWASGIITKAKTELPKVIESITGFFTELPGKMLNIGKSIVEGLWNGIKNAVNWLKQKLKEFADGVLAGIKDALGIASPSRVMANQVGKWIPAGIAQGIAGNISLVKSAMAALSSQINDSQTLNASVTGIAATSGGGYSYATTKLYLDSNQLLSATSPVQYGRNNMKAQARGVVLA